MEQNMSDMRIIVDVFMGLHSWIYPQRADCGTADLEVNEIRQFLNGRWDSLGFGHEYDDYIGNGLALTWMILRMINTFQDCWRTNQGGLLRKKMFASGIPDTLQERWSGIPWTKVSKGVDEDGRLGNEWNRWQVLLLGGQATGTSGTGNATVLCSNRLLQKNTSVAGELVGVEVAIALSSVQTQALG